MKNKDFLTDESYDKIYPSGSKPASIYGLPEIHKLNSSKDNLSHPFLYIPIFDNFQQSLIIKKEP